MVDVVAHRPPTTDDITTIRTLAAESAATDGHPSFGDTVWRDLAHPTERSLVLLASEGGEAVGALHAAPAENDRDGNVVTVALVVQRAHRGRGTEHLLVDAALTELTRDAGMRLVLWVFGAGDEPATFATDNRFALERELQQLRVRLPIAEPPQWPPDIEVRAFRPGLDDEAWLAVNNRAFADDPDQRGWTIETLRTRLAEPWFDPAGFLLAWDEHGLAGFCWTKIHPAAPPDEPEALGEIYVIGVDPDYQGRGLGRALVITGLHWLHGHGTPVGMLFVDAANEAAVALYRALGFEVARRDRAYGRDLP
jgi:mycothiol synthase